jgi:LysR family pca operon transcriptional activator
MHNENAMHPGVKLRQLRLFLDCAATGSLTVAARSMGITQPAASRSLAELEGLLGQALFRRQGRRMVLTGAGHLLQRHAGTAIRSLDAGALALRDDGGGGLRLGVLPTAAAVLFPQVALRFRALAPGQVLTVHSGPQPYLMRLLREGGIEAMLGRMPTATEMPDLAFTHLYDEDVVLAIRAGHPLAGRPAAEVLPQVPLILPPEGAAIRRQVADYLAALGLGGLAPAWETVAVAVGRGIVLASDAVWFISRGVVAEDVAAGVMAVLPPGSRALAGAVGLTRRQGPEVPGLSLLMALAQEAARDRRPAA